MDGTQELSSGPQHKEASERLDRYRVTPGKGVTLADWATGEIRPPELDEKTATTLLRRRVDQLALLQEKLFIAKPAAVLIVLQAMDCGGKDSTIAHVTEGVNPAGVEVTSFKTPTPEENGHDFLWRVSRALPVRGMIGIFNRSHYESVLISRVHPEFLANEGYKNGPPGDKFWDKRLDAITAFERHLANEGTRIVKIYLHISLKEQKKRLLARLDDPLKKWKFDPSDVRERALWPQYAEAYEAAIKATAAPHAPWYIVPGDHKWYARLIVAEAILSAFEGLDLERPPLSADAIGAIDKARKILEG